MSEREFEEIQSDRDKVLRRNVTLAKDFAESESERNELQKKIRTLRARLEIATAQSNRHLSEIERLRGGLRQMRAQYPAQARLVDKDARIAELEEEVERLREDHDGGCENCEQLREDADLLGAKVDVYEAEAEEYKDRIRHLEKPTLIEENATLRARLERAIEPGSPEARKISEVLVWAAKHFRARIVDLDADQRSIVKAKDEEIERLQARLAAAAEITGAIADKYRHARCGNVPPMGEEIDALTSRLGLVAWPRLPALEGRDE